MELSIDTSTKWAGLALSNQGNIIVEVNWYSEQNHSVELLPAIDRIVLQFIIVAYHPSLLNSFVLYSY